MLESLVLLPGMDGTGELFAPLRAVIPPNWAVHVVSYPEDGEQTYEELFSFVEEHLEGMRSVVLVAESFSGPLAIRYAADHQKQVRAVILAASFVRSPIPTWFRSFAKPPLVRLLCGANRIIRFFLLNGARDKSLVSKVSSLIGKISPRMLAERIRTICQVDCVAALSSCTVPMLYLAATRDRLVGRRSGDLITSVKLDCMYRVIDGPHLLLQASPKGSWEEIESFLRQRSEV